MEMSSQLYIILTLVESQMPHSSLLRYRSGFVWQPIRNKVNVEWERPGVCRSDSIHRNLGTFSQALPLFRGECSADFPMLLPLKLQTGEMVSCVKQLSAVIADLSSWDWDQNVQTPTFAVAGSSARSWELPWAFPKEKVLPSGSELRKKWTFLQSVPFQVAGKEQRVQCFWSYRPLSGIAEAKWTLGWSLAHSSQILSSWVLPSTLPTQIPELVLFSGSLPANWIVPVMLQWHFISVVCFSWFCML